MRMTFEMNDRRNLGRLDRASTNRHRKRYRPSGWIRTSVGLATMVLSMLVGWTLFVPQSARAMIWGQYRRCDVGWVTIEGVSFPTRTCWYETLNFPDPPQGNPPEDDPVPWAPWYASYSHPPRLPDTACVEARVNEYGHYKQQDATIVYKPKWAFVTSIGPKEYYYSPWSKQQPPGYNWLLGLTHHFPGPMEEALVEIYRGAYDPNWNQPAASIGYIDPNTGVADRIFGPFSADEMLTIVLEHEFGHASSSGKSEDELYGYGVAALEAYRNDPNADPCN